MNYIEIILKLFPVFALVIGGVAYFIKRRYDLLAKKVEMKYGLFQQNKFDAIKGYFNSYAAFERAISNISPYRIASSEYDAKELDEMTLERLNNLISSDLYLSLFLEKDELEKFNTITRRIIEVHWKYLDAYLNTERNRASEVGSGLNYLLKETCKMNSVLLKGIGIELKEAYSKDRIDEFRFFSTSVRRNKS